MSAVVDVWGNSLKAINARKSEALAASVDVTTSVIEAFFEGGDSAEVNALDLYEVIFKDQKAKIESLTTLNSAYKTRASNHALACADYEARIAALTSARDELALALGEQGLVGDTGAGSAELRQLLADEMTKSKNLALALEQAEQESSAKIAALVDQNTTYRDEASALLNDLDALKGDKAELQSKLEYAQGECKILENKLLTAEGHAKEAAKASDKVAKDLQAKIDRITRSLEVANADVAKEKDRRAEMYKGNLAAIDAMKKSKQTMVDMEAEIAELRMVRRYLVMMMDCALHDHFFESDNGYASVLTYNTHKISSPEDKFVIDEAFPVGFWVNKNGFACILGVSTPDENGERSLVMPANEKISKRATDAICPPKSEQNAILDSLMQYDAAACQESFKRSRDKISQLAIYGEHEENLLQENKNLIAITKRAVAGGRTVVPNRTGHSSKRKPKPRR